MAQPWQMSNSSLSFAASIVWLDIVSNPLFVVQVLIYRALGWKQPQFSHVSLILAPDKSKLSKRHGATSLGEFRQEGYLPQAMLNYLTLLGWNDGSEQEVFTLQQLQVTSLPSLAASLLHICMNSYTHAWTSCLSIFISQKTPR